MKECWINGIFVYIRGPLSRGQTLQLYRLLKSKVAADALILTCYSLHTLTTVNVYYFKHSHGQVVFLLIRLCFPIVTLIGQKNIAFQQSCLDVVKTHKISPEQ